eukprot:s2380_g11.t1
MTERLLRLKVYALIVACSCDSTFPVSLQLKVDRALMENGTKAASHADDLTLPGSRGFRSCSQAARESRLSHPSPVASHTWLAQKWQRAPPSSARQSSSWRKMVALERSFKASVLQPHGRTNAVQELQHQLVEAQRRFAAAAAGTPPPRPPAVAWGPPQVNEPAEVVAPSDVVVERRRQFGDRLLRLWVEDVPFHGGARVHAMDTTSFVRSVAEFSDMDIQALALAVGHGHGDAAQQLERGELEVTVQLEAGLAQQECGRVFGLFGEVAQLDLTRALRVCFFESKAALGLQDYLDTHGSLWRSPPTVGDSNAFHASGSSGGYGYWEPGRISSRRPSDAKEWLKQEVRNYLEIDEGRLLRGQETRCSLMIGQVPKNCDSIILLEKLRELELLHRLRFFYMPIDKSRKRHFGYVFLEVSTPQDVIALVRLLPRLGEMLGTSRSNRQLHLHFARIQGWKSFMRQYSDLDFIFEPNANVRPQLFLPHRSSQTDGDFRDLLPSDLTKTYYQRFKCYRECQVMFDSWWQRLARSRQAALADGDPLREFLLCLLDASYFELDGIGQLQLRVPAAVPPLPPVPDKELIEILSYKASSHSSAEPLTKDWIRDKLLVPKSVVSSSSSFQRSRGCAAYAPKPRSSSARGAQSSSRARPSSARPSSTRSAARSSSSGPVPRWSMSDASAEGSFFNDSERPSSTRCPVPGGLRLRHPLQEREKANLPYRVPPPSSAKSAEQVEAQVKAKAPVPHSAHAPAAHVPTAPAPAVVAARAANAVYPSHQRRRPASAKIHKHKRVADPEEDIIYEDVEGPHVDRELRAPGSSGDAQAPETERPVSIPSHEAASQAKRHHRAWRPASAKVHKHKRVERCENAEDIYDDLEPSLAESSDFSGQEDAASPDKPFEDAEELTPPSQGVDVWIHQESRGEAFHGHFEFVAPRRSSPPSLDRRRKTA